MGNGGSSGRRYGDRCPARRASIRRAKRRTVLCCDADQEIGYGIVTHAVRLAQDGFDGNACFFCFPSFSCRIWHVPNQAAPACPRQARYRASPGRRGLISNRPVAGPRPLLNGVPPYEQRTGKRCPAAFSFGSGANDAGCASGNPVSLTPSPNLKPTLADTPPSPPATKLQPPHRPENKRWSHG